MRRGLKYLLLLCSAATLVTCRKKEEIPPWENISQSALASHTPTLAVDNIGDVYVVWADTTPGNIEIFFAEKTSNGSWSQGMNISNSPSMDVVPFIDVDNSGNVHVCWWDIEYDKPDTRIRYRMRNASGVWENSEILALSSTSDTTHHLPRITTDINNNVYIMWHGVFGNSCLHYKIKTANGQWSNTMEVPNALTTNPAELATDSQGNLHLAWEGGSNRIDYQTRTPDGNWQNLATITSEHQPLRPDITVDGSGVVYVTWFAQDENRHSYVYYAHNKSGTWSEAIKLPMYKETDIGVLNSIAATDDGFLHVVWQNWTDDTTSNYGHADVFYVKKYPDDTWSDIHNISKTEGKSICGPQSIATNDLGDAHVVWTDNELGNFEILYLCIPSDSL